MGRMSFAGTIALELHQLRTRNAELEPLAKGAKGMLRTIADQAREIERLSKILKRQASSRQLIERKPARIWQVFAGGRK